MFTKLFSVLVLAALMLTGGASVVTASPKHPGGADPIRCGTARTLYGTFYVRQSNELHYAVTFSAVGGGHVWFFAPPAGETVFIPPDNVEREYRIDVAIPPEAARNLPLQIHGIADAFPCATMTDLNVSNIQIWVRMPFGKGEKAISH